MQAKRYKPWLYTNNQWDEVHDFDLGLNWFEDEGEGEICLPCLGIFDDCDDVLKKIEAFKKAYHDKKTVTGKVPPRLNEKILVAKFIKLDKTDFTTVNVILYGTSRDYTIDPKKYSDFYYTITPYEDNPEKKILARGFEFKDIENNTLVLRIYIEEPSDKMIEKYDAFKAYLFGLITKTSKKASNFDKYQDKIFDHEGGYVDDPIDKGGATNKGITFNTFEAYAKEDLGIEPTLENLKALTNDQASIIYKKRYWDKIKADEINNGSIAYMLYDFNVNAGANACKELQRALNDLGNKVDVDGAIGKQTIEAINKTDAKELFDTFKQRRLDYYQDLVDNSVDNYKKNTSKGY